MSKKEIKEILKKYGYKLIGPSWYTGNDDDSVLFRAYDKTGTCFEFFVNWVGTDYSHVPFARRHMLSSITTHDADDVTYMFFKGVA